MNSSRAAVVCLVPPACLRSARQNTASPPTLRFFKLGDIGACGRAPETPGAVDEVARVYGSVRDSECPQHSSFSFLDVRTSNVAGLDVERT
jgi:hypothetical protein